MPWRLLEVYKKSGFWTQWAAVALVKSLIVSTIMAFLANYATVFFSINYGFRVPVEGVPHLSFTVGLATFALMMGTFFGFAVIIVMALPFQNFAASAARAGKSRSSSKLINLINRAYSVLYGFLFARIVLPVLILAYAALTVLVVIKSASSLNRVGCPLLV